MARRVLISMLLAFALLAAAGVAGWRLNLRERSRYTDAATINTPVASAPIRQILWQPAALLPEAGDASADQYEPRISADGQTMVFVRGRAGRNADLYQSRRTVQGWSTPEPVATINTESDELGPELSADGRTLYFYSDRAGTRGGYDLWLLRRDEGGDWKEPVNLGPSINTEFNEYGPALTPDNKRLFFSSNRPRPGDPPQFAQRDPWTATLREHRTRHDYDLYFYDFDRATDPRATDSLAVDNPGPSTSATPGELVGAPGATPATPDTASPVLELNTPHDEGAPVLSPAGDFLYFASDRPGQGGFDIFRSRIIRGRIQIPENIGPAINSANNDLDPSLSTDGFRIYFSSDRALAGEGGDIQAEASQGPSVRVSEPARYSLYSSASREVFIETDPLNAASLLARFWAAAWPWLLALLAALILATLFYLAMRDAAIRHRLAQLSLMAKCLLISLLIHAALLSAFAAWRVGTAIGELLRDGGAGNGTQVTLGASAGSGTLETQIRGSLTTVGIEAPTIEASRPETTPVEIQAPSIQVATTPANLTFTLSPMAFRAEEATGPVASAAPAPATPALVESAPASRAPTPEPAASQRTESRGESIPDAATLPVRAASVNSAGTTPGTIAINPAAAPIAALSPSAAGSSISDAPTSIAGGTPSATISPVLPAASTPAGLASRLPQAGTGAPAAAEPAAPSSSFAANVPTTAQPTPPGAAGAAHMAIAPAAAPIASAPGGATTFTPTDAPTSAASVPAAGNSTKAPELPSMSGAAIAARLPGAGTPEHSATSEMPSASSGSMPPALGDSAPSRPSLALGTPGASTSVHLAPTASGAGAVAPSSSASGRITPTDAPASSGLSAAPAPPPLGTDLKGLPSIAFRSNIPAVPSDPPQTAPAPKPESFAQRAPEVRTEVLRKTGGSPETERAVAAALDWFKLHQSADGRWSGQHFDRACTQCSSPAEIEADAAMTGITLLCYLGAGHTHQADGPHRDSVKKALAWIVDRTDSSGDLRRGETMYSQTIAAIALCEAFAMTRDPWLEAPARRAITFVARGSTRGGSADTSVLGWQIMAIKSAQRAGFNVPNVAFDAARRWLDQVSIPAAPGRYAYSPGGVPSPAATAEAMFVQQLLGRLRDEPRMRQSADFILTAPPAWRREAPTFYWYYATLAIFQQQGEHWTTWNEGIARELLKNQRQDDSARGSWDPQDQWSRLGGRVYQTAVCTLSLEVYYRYRLAEPQTR